MSDFYVAGVSPTLTLKTGRIDADKYREIFEFLSQAGAELESFGSSCDGPFTTLTLSFRFDGALHCRPRYERTKEPVCLK